MFGNANAVSINNSPIIVEMEGTYDKKRNR
jgi:hypothetical protein